MQPNKYAFNHELFHIYNLSGNTNLLPLQLIQTCRLTDWSFYRALALWLNHIHRSLSFNLSFSPFSPRVPLSLYCVCKLIYKFLLLFIGNLKIASTWVNWLTIKDCNNYLPNNLASEINSIGLHCRIVDSSLLSDWLTRSWLV